MSAAYKCDKCSVYKDGAPSVTITFTLTSTDKPWVAPRGVCMGCAQEIALSKEEKERLEKQAAEREERQRQIEAEREKNR